MKMKGRKQIQRIRENLCSPFCTRAEIIKDYTRAIAEVKAIPLTTREEQLEAIDFMAELGRDISRLQRELENPTETEEERVIHLQQLIDELPELMEARDAPWKKAKHSR